MKLLCLLVIICLTLQGTIGSPLSDWAIAEGSCLGVHPRDRLMLVMAKSEVDTSAGSPYSVCLLKYILPLTYRRFFLKPHTINGYGVYKPDSEERPPVYPKNYLRDKLRRLQALEKKAKENQMAPTKTKGMGENGK